MSYEGQAPPPGGYPPNGHQQSSQGPGEHAQPGQASSSGYGQPAPYQQPGRQGGPYAGQPSGPAPAPGPSGQHGQQPSGSYAQAPAAPRPNPFAGIPTSDFVRDAIAALLLLVSFALPVTYGREFEDIGDRFHFVVILVTVLSIVSLTLPYLARAGVFPPSWTVHTTRKARLLANAPYVVVVLVYVVMDILTSDEITGLGTIFALGLAGAVLAAQPRQCEMGPEDLDRDVSKLWWSITAAIGGFIALTYVVSLIFFLIDIGDFADFWGTVAAVGAVLAWIVAVAFSLWAIYGTVVLRSPSWRLVLIGIGVMLVCAFVFGAGEGSSLVKIESLRVFGLGIIQPLSLEEGLGAIFVPAAAAAAAAPATLRALSREPRSTTWIFTAVHGFDYIALLAAATVVTSALLFFVDVVDRSTGVLVTTIVLGLLILAVALYARLSLAKNPSASRILALGAAGVTFVLGLVIVIMVPEEAFGDGKYITVGHLLLAFGLPVLVAIALTVPKDVREYFASHRPVGQGATNAAYQWAAPQGQAPGYQYPGQSGAPAGPGAPGGAGAPGGYGAPGQAPQAYGAPAQAGPWQTQGAGGNAPQAPQPQQQAPQQQPQQHVAQSEPVQPVQAEPVQEVSHETAPHEMAPQLADPSHREEPVSEVTEVVEAPTSSGFTAAQALDPSTPGAVLAQIVQDAPELRAQVAANPSTYPALLGWLSQLGDPEVDEALRRREH